MGDNLLLILIHARLICNSGITRVFQIDPQSQNEETDTLEKLKLQYSNLKIELVSEIGQT